MKVFYGVQGTGNGHITRARVMAVELQKAGIEVDYMFTGRPADKYFDMEVFANYQIKTGLTFDTKDGRVNYIRTALDTNIKEFVRDVYSLDLSTYDVVISDYEPITSWAAKVRGMPTIGVGHQYVFNYDIPKSGFNPITYLIMNQFAPVTHSFGAHWHHFDNLILPPIIDTTHTHTSHNDSMIVVYLPFENQQNVIEMLRPFNSYQFHVYSPENIKSPFDHIIYHLPSREGFQSQVRQCNGIICNAGFELASEALHLGKRLLVKPLYQQAEQISNALALTKLGYGNSMDTLSKRAVRHWLNATDRTQLIFPNVAREIVERIQTGQLEMDYNWVKDVWDEVMIIQNH